MLHCNSLSALAQLLDSLLLETCLAILGLLLQVDLVHFSKRRLNMCVDSSISTHLLQVNSDHPPAVLFL